MATISKSDTAQAGSWKAVDGGFAAVTMKRRFSTPVLYFIGPDQPDNDTANGVQTWEAGAITVRDLDGSHIWVKAVAANNPIDLILSSASVLAVLAEGTATEAKQATAIARLDTILSSVDGLEGGLASILAKLIATPATAAGQADIVAALAGIVLAAGENHIGAVGGNSALALVTPTLITTPYASGKVLFASTPIGNVMRSALGTGSVQSLAVVDAAAQGAAMDLLLFSAPVPSFGNPGADCGLTKAEALAYLGTIPIYASDFTAAGQVKVASPIIPARVVKAAAGKDLHCAAIVRGAPTFSTTTSLQLGWGLYQD